MEMVLFCMKAAGSICVMISGSGLGWVYGNIIERRYKELNDLRRSFQIIYGDISYGATSFGEILHHVQEYSLPAYGEMFRYMEEEMKKKNKRKFATIWEEGIGLYRNKFYLGNRDIMELKQVGQNIGNVHKEQQLALLQLYMDKLQNSLKELEGEKNQKIKLCRMLGTLGSIFVIVILL